MKWIKVLMTVLIVAGSLTLEGCPQKTVQDASVGGSQGMQGDVRMQTNDGGGFDL